MHAQADTLLRGRWLTEVNPCLGKREAEGGEGRREERRSERQPCRLQRVEE